MGRERETVAGTRTGESQRMGGNRRDKNINETMREESRERNAKLLLLG